MVYRFYNFDLQEFLEKFELGLKDGYMEESLLRNIESNKIKIFNTFINNPNTRFIKVYVSKLWNICRMLNYTRNIKDTDNNYYLLRLKDFLCDLFILIFSISVNEISLHDVFNMIQIVTEVGQSWMKLEIRMSSEGWVRKIENLMRYLITKINEIEILISLEKKFYINLMEYLSFYIEFFLHSNSQFNNGKKLGEFLPSAKNTFALKENHCEEILKIIILIKNIKFIENDNSTRNAITNFLNALKNIHLAMKCGETSQTHSENIQNVLMICQGFDSLKFKILLPFDLISEFYKFYIQILQNCGSLNEAENVLKNLFELVPPNSKEEVECYLMNLEITANFFPNLESITKITDLIEILFEHREFNLNYFEEILSIVTNHKMFDLFLDSFLTKIKHTKSLKIGTGISQFSYDNVKNHKNLPFLFVFILFKSKLICSNNFQLLPQTFYEILKTFSECLLENYSDNSYNEEHMAIIPSLLKNIVILFLKIEKTNENFSSYFLLEIIKKIKSDAEYQFVKLSLELYIEKRDFIKLKTIIQELEEKKFKRSFYFYSQIILLISEGNRWNAHNRLNILCLNLNSTEDFHVIFYVKLFDFILNSNFQDLSLISLILQNFATKFFILLKEGDCEKLKFEDLSKNKILSFFEILNEIFSFISKLSNFSSQIILFVDLMNVVGNFLEFKVIDENSKFLVQDITAVVDLINILLNLKSSTNISMRFEDYPEFILISCVKLFNFIFTNFFIFSTDFFKIEDVKMNEQIKNICDLFELYKNLSIFYFSYEFTNIKDQDDTEHQENQSLEMEHDLSVVLPIDNELNQSTYKKRKFLYLQEVHEKYSKNFLDAKMILLNKFSKNIEYTSLIEEKIESFINNTKSIDELLQIQIMTKLANEETIEEYVLGLISEKIENKKFLFVINSILFQNGLKNLSRKFIKKILNTLLYSFQELVNKFYSIEEVCMLFKDYININDDVIVKITYLKEFSTFIIKLIGKTDEILINDNIEWILYKIFGILEENYQQNQANIASSSYRFNKNDKEFLILKSIFDEISSIHLKNKSFVLCNLIDIIMKKLII